VLSYVGSGSASLSSIALSGLGNIVQLAITGSGSVGLSSLGVNGAGFVGVIAVGGTSTRHVLTASTARKILTPTITRKFS
jgi:hypothetical protein